MGVSVIIPVYNVKNYLNVCVESVVNQNDCNCEIILVDDGSTDGSEIICDRYAEKYENVRVIHQKNQGLSAARNAGCKVATKEYLWFVDSDDFILDLEALAHFDEIARKKPDVIAFNWKKVYDANHLEVTQNELQLDSFENVVLSGQEYLLNMLKKKPLYEWYAWAYLYRRHYWEKNNFSYPEGKKYEDIPTTYRTLILAEKVCCYSTAVYGYRIGRVGSITTSRKISALEDGLQLAADSLRNIEKSEFFSNDLKFLLENNFSCLYYMLMLSSHSLDRKDQKEFKKKLKNQFWMCEFTTQKPQIWVKKSIEIFGLPFVYELLRIRTRLKNK